MKTSYQALLEIENNLKTMVEKTEIEFATAVVEFFQTLPNQKEEEITPSDARMAKVRTMYLLERLVDLEKDGANRIRVLSFIDNAIIGLARIIAGNREGTILDESLVEEAEVDANLAIQQKQLGVVLETMVQIPLDRIPADHPRYDEIRKQAIGGDDDSNIIIVPKRK